VETINLLILLIEQMTQSHKAQEGPWCVLVCPIKHTVSNTHNYYVVVKVLARNTWKACTVVCDRLVSAACGHESHRLSVKQNKPWEHP
jgi:hypothetical protein